MTEESYTDDADVSQIEERIDELEETIRQMLPSRREALGMGVAGLAGASLMSGTASAGSAQVGTSGDNSNLVDLVAEDVTITDTLNTASISGAAADEALLSDGTGDLKFGSVTAVEEVSTFGNLPAIDPPQLAYVTDEGEYYRSKPETGTPFDITTSISTTSINAQLSFPHGIAWNNDGTRLYEIGSDGPFTSDPDEIYQYTVSTPFDIDTATSTTSITPQDAEPTGIAWNDDGSRLYEVGEDSDNIYQYTVSTPFDISTASFATSINTQDSQPQGIAWNNDGSRLYEVGEGSNQIYQYNVSTPFDITTASFSTSVNTQDVAPTGIAWNNDGTRLYEVDGQNFIFQLDVATPFDITTTSLSATISGNDGVPLGIAWNNDGTRIYEVGRGTAKIYQTTVSSGGWETF